MDSFSDHTLAQATISASKKSARKFRILEDDHRAKGIKLSGRVLHDGHYSPLLPSSPVELVSLAPRHSSDESIGFSCQSYTYGS